MASYRARRFAEVLELVMFTDPGQPQVWTTPIPPHLKKLVEDAVVQAYKEQTKQLTAANPVVKAII